MSAQYQRLSTSDMDKCDTALIGGNPAGTNASYRLPPLLRWAIAAILLVFFIDLIGALYLCRSFATVFQDKDFAANLEYADPYVGLKEMYADGRISSAKISKIIMRPTISVQIFPEEPHRTPTRGERDYWTEAHGTLSPNERHLLVDSKTHTLVQFRAIDFGMESCHLVLDLPAPNTTLERGASSSFLPNSRFDVFRLSATRPLDSKTISYAKRPAVVERVAASLTVNTEDGKTLVHAFPCPSMSLHVFEMRCAAGAECFVDTWSSQNTSYGLVMHQHQTI